MIAASLAFPADFEGWRRAARRFLAADVPPANIAWMIDGEEAGLFPAFDPPPAADALPPVTVPAAFVELTRKLVCHSDPMRFDLAYRLLRRHRAEPHLLSVLSDFEVHRAHKMAKAVARDMHKMTAFVRFREARDEGGRIFLAWFEPAHHIVDATAPFFVRRFSNERWAILTPERSAHWDGSELTVGPSDAEKRNLPAADVLEDYWRIYFASIFNPARLKIAAMQREMPKKYWRNLPEASLIAPLIASAQERTETMIENATTAPNKRFRPRPAQLTLGEADAAGEATLDGLRAEAAGCKRCPLWEPATQTVFGEGPQDAAMMFVGEQPGDQEDLAGHPFVGPAGAVFDKALGAAGIERSQVYVTNAVKHFKFEPRGKRRLHQKPNPNEIMACRWWLEQERLLVRPKLIVAMGATAARSVLDRTVKLMEERGKPMAGAHGEVVLLTVHPSYLLRLPDEAAKREQYAAFVRDLREAARLVGEMR